MQTDIVIDVDNVAKWLKAHKFTLLSTLKRSYTEGVDYTITKAKNPNRKKYGNNYKRVLITPACFKELSMRTASKNGDMMRRYFIEIEDAFLKYRNQTIKGLETDISDLAPRIKKGRPGYVYVVLAKTDTSLYKVGKATQLQNRMNTYNTGHADDVKIVYQIQTDHMDDVEKCIATLCRTKRYRKRKEVYNIDIDILKEVMSTCASLQAKVARPISRKKIEGGKSLHAVLLPTNDDA
jgi:phage anti-repressor protein